MTRITAEIFALRSARIRADLLDQKRRDEIERLASKAERHLSESQNFKSRGETHGQI